MSGIIDIAGIMRCVDLGWQETMPVVGAAMTEAIEDEYYDWPNETIRKNGTRVTAPRNIVDTGELKDSQYQQSIGKGEEEIVWTADHAAINHNGGRKADGTVFPARRWTEHAIKGDITAPIEYQQADALLDVPAELAARIQSHLEDVFGG